MFAVVQFIKVRIAFKIFVLANLSKYSDEFNFQSAVCMKVDLDSAKANNVFHKNAEGYFQCK